MSYNQKEVLELCNNTRTKLIYSSKMHNGEGHWGGCLSCVEILSVLYGAVSNVGDKSLPFSERDKFIMSKGHSAKTMYTVMNLLGYLNDEVYDTFGEKGSPMSVLGEYAPDYGVIHSGGSLGLGLPLAVGEALLAKKKGFPYITYVLVGDGEMNEGSNWEALMTASKYGLDNLCCIIDFNKYQADGACEDILPWGDFGAKIRAFGCELYEIDGHSCDALYQAFQARQLSGCPKVILAHTVKGKGIEFMEHDNKWHHTRLRGVELEKAREVVGC